MGKRFVSIWFRHLRTDWFARLQPNLNQVPFVLRTPIHGRMVITSTNAVAESKGITTGMVLADARAIFPDIHVLDDKSDLADKLLKRLAEWCIRFTPIAAIDPPDGIMLDATGCSHLWGGDLSYLNEIYKRLENRGYDVRLSMADTIGAAWGVARFGKSARVIESGKHIEALMSLPPAALRIDQETVERLHKLGLRQIRQFINMPRQSLRRRFGPQFLQQLDRAIGQEMETLDPVVPIEPYLERLPCLEPIVTLAGIEIALRTLLETLCDRLRQEQKGLRNVVLKSYRVDGKVEKIEIGTNQPSHHVEHLFKLFETKLSSIEPALGIELFTLEAGKVEEYVPEQEKIWETASGLEDIRLAELLDRLANKVGSNVIHRYLPDQHYWPERSIKPATTLQEKSDTPWRNDKRRPLQLLSNPEAIEVTAPIPDYPPLLFRYRGRVHQIVKADGPERIEQEWWIQSGQHRDYYAVEDEEGQRYWLFRLGHYHDKTFQWFLHGFFA